MAGTTSFREPKNEDAVEENSTASASSFPDAKMDIVEDSQIPAEPAAKRAATGDLREVKHLNGTASLNGTNSEHASTSGTTANGAKRRIALKRGPDVLDTKDLLPKGRDGGLAPNFTGGSSSNSAAGGIRVRTERQVTFRAIPEKREDVDVDDDENEQSSSEDDADGGDAGDITADGGDIVADDDDGLKAKVAALMLKYPGSFVAAEDVVYIRLVRREADAVVTDKATNDVVSFKPPWTDVHLGEAAALFGYKKLRIDIAYTAGWLHCYVGNTEEERVPIPDNDVELNEVLNISEENGRENAPLPTSGVKTPVQKIMGFYPTGTTHDLEEFKQQIQQDANFTPFGTLVTEYEAANTNKLKSMFCVYTCPITHDNFIAYFQRMQTLTLWFVDGANYINTDESGWQIYTVYEKYEIDGRIQYGLVGYCNTYNYPVFIKSRPNRRRAARNGTASTNEASILNTGAIGNSADRQPSEEHAVNGNDAYVPALGEPKVRRRIAQFLILPPFQRRGHGIRLLDAIQRDSIADPNVISVTVEEAVPELTRMRLCVGAWQIFALDNVMEWLPQAIEKGYVTRDDVRPLVARVKLPVDVILRCVQMLIVRVLSGMERDEEAVEVLRQCEAHLITKEVEDAQLVQHRLKMGMVDITTDDEEEQVKVRSMWIQNVKNAVHAATTRFRELPAFAAEQLAALKGLNAMMERCYCDKLGMSI